MTQWQPTYRAFPEHIAPEQVFHFDIYEPIEGEDDYQSWFRKLQDHGAPDIFWTASNGGHQVVMRGEDFDYFLKSPELYSSRINVVPRERILPIVSKPIQLDPPDYTRCRNLLAPAFVQDFENLGEIQAGVKSRGFEFGRANPLAEMTCVNFHRHVRRYVDSSND